MSKSNSVVDFSYLDEIAGGDQSFIDEMCDLFMNNTPPSIAEMIKAQKENNPVKLGEVAHKMKPSAIYMGNKELELLLKELQELKNTKEIGPDTEGKVKRVEELSFEIIKAIRRE